MGKGHGSELTF